LTLPRVAEAVLTPFFAGTALAGALPALCDDALDRPTPLVALAAAGDYSLELFHGPTAAFKDFGARFLAACLSRIEGDAARPRTILAATSGDTGAAVAAAFQQRPGFRVLVLYPQGRVSPRQAHVLGSFGGNVTALRVQGGFDACQAMTKHVLADAALQATVPLGSANSISLGRLLPQMAYHALAAWQHATRAEGPLNLIVPSGNLGDALAAWLARRMGAPIGDVHLACNANATLPEYFHGGEYRPREAIATLANAMDIGAPSNFERLAWWLPEHRERRHAFAATTVDDATITRTLREAPARHGIVPCPHTACALHVLETLRAQGDARPWAVVATAHPAKFEGVVEPLLGHPLPLPPGLAESLARPAHAEPIAASPQALADWLRAHA
jgi:threonine synthase